MNIKHSIAFAAIALLLAGCGKDFSTTNTKPTLSFPLTGELSGCKYVRVETEGSMLQLHVIRCPNSSTSTGWMLQSGRQSLPMSVSVVD